MDHHEPQDLTGDPDDAAEGPLDAFVSGAAYAALGVLGAVVGVVGAYAHSWTAGPVPVAGVAVILVNLGMVRLAGWALGGRIGASVPALLWTAAAVALAVPRGEGDLIVPGTWTGYLFIIGGLVAAVIGVSLVPARHPPGAWLTGGVPLARG
ncbi:DUF6113 family protein [Actinomadura sp. 21ATH]|uniref:DUF6113 family protein n=1 Tax=Actinomadura sp. 21ATH TaxID=1735444 RepID=UPI0035C16D8D